MADQARSKALDLADVRKVRDLFELSRSLSIMLFILDVFLDTLSQPHVYVSSDLGYHGRSLAMHEL